jgi:hypothetical protein
LPVVSVRIHCESYSLSPGEDGALHEISLSSKEDDDFQQRFEE